MALTTQQYQDLIAYLREHPEAVAELRPVVMGPEIIAIPSRMDRVEEVLRELAERDAEVSARIDEQREDFNSRMDRLTDRMDQLTVRMDQLTDRMDQLTVRMDQLTVRMDQLSEDVRLIAKGLEHNNEVLRGLSAEVGKLSAREGAHLEGRFVRNIGNWLRDYLRKPKLTQLDQLDRIDEAVAAGAITSFESRDLGNVDFVVAGGDLETGESRLLVCEVSVTIHESDVERAVRRAGVLRRAGYLVTPFVGGEGIAARLQEQAEHAGVIVDIREPAA